MSSTQTPAASTAAPAAAAAPAAGAAAAGGAAPASGATTPTGAAAAGANYHSASLYVGDLNQDVTEALLFEVFNNVGPVASVRVCRDAATRRSLGYAYVNFHRSEDADRAMNLLNFTPINNKACRIMWSHRDPSLRRSGQGNIFVKNLSKKIDNRTLYDTFQIFGPILSCKVATNSKGESLGYGFVHYENDESAAKAIDKVDGKVIAEQKVSVAAFKSKKDRGGESKSNFTNLYVKFLPNDFNKDKLEEMFGKHGTVTSCMVAMSEDGKTCRGFGFVNFVNPEEAAAAVQALNNFEVSGKKLYVGRAQKKEERERELRERFEKLKLERHGKPQLNLYVKNLSDDTDEKKLREEFSKFGSITSCKVMRETTGKSRGFGFISFSAPEEATKAVSEMNNKMMDSKPLYVALAQRKDVRRAELEARRGGGHYPPQGGPHMFAGAPMFYPPQARGFMYGPGPMGGQMGGGRGGWMPVPPGAGGPMMRGPHGQPGMPYGYPPMMNPGFTGRGGPGFMPQQPRQPGQGGRGRGGPGMGRGSPNDAPRRMNGQMGGGAPHPQQQPQQGGGQQPQTQAGAPGGPAPKIEYTQTARNQQRNPQQGGAAGAAAGAGGDGAAAPKTGQNLISQLAAASGAQQKQMIGEHLFMRIKQSEAGLAGKITGMLLEMDSSELIALLESSEALQEKIQEAKDVLAQHEVNGTTSA